MRGLIDYGRLPVRDPAPSRLHRLHRLRPRLSGWDHRHHGAAWHLQHGCSGRGLGRFTGRGWQPSLAAWRCSRLLLHGRRLSHAVRHKTDLLLSESCVPVCPAAPPCVFLPVLLLSNTTRAHTPDPQAQPVQYRLCARVSRVCPVCVLAYRVPVASTVLWLCVLQCWSVGAFNAATRARTRACLARASLSEINFPNTPAPSGGARCATTLAVREKKTGSQAKFSFRFTRRTRVRKCVFRSVDRSRKDAFRHSRAPQPGFARANASSPRASVSA